MPYALGIDLGGGRTTAAISRNDRERWLDPEVVALDGDPAGMASVLHLTDEGAVEVGSAALRSLPARAGWTTRSVADRVGDEIPITLGGAPYSAEVLAAAVVGWIVDYVEATEGAPATQLVVTHPSDWGMHRRALLLGALREVNLPDPTLLPRPVAVAESHAAAQRVEVGEHLAVLLLGSPGPESAVLRRGSFGFELRAHTTGGDHLGDDLFDDLVVEQVVAGMKVAPEGGRLAALRAACASARERLCVEDAVSVSGVRVTRADFEELIRPAVESTVESLTRLLQGSGPVGTVVVAGGSGRIPLVAELVAGRTRARVVATDPETSVARGAAAAAAKVAKPTVRATAVTMTPEPLPPSAVTHTDLMRLDELPEEDLTDHGPPPPRPPVSIAPLEPPRRGFLGRRRRPRQDRDDDAEPSPRRRRRDRKNADPDGPRSDESFLDLSPRRRSALHHTDAGSRAAKPSPDLSDAPHPGRFPHPRRHHNAAEPIHHPPDDPESPLDGLSPPHRRTSDGHEPAFDLPPRQAADTEHLSHDHPAHPRRAQPHRPDDALGTWHQDEPDPALDLPPRSARGEPHQTDAEHPSHRPAHNHDPADDRPEHPRRRKPHRRSSDPDNRHQEQHQPTPDHPPQARTSEPHLANAEHPSHRTAHDQPAHPRRGKPHRRSSNPDNRHQEQHQPALDYLPQAQASEPHLTDAEHLSHRTTHDHDQAAHPRRGKPHGVGGDMSSREPEDHEPALDLSLSPRRRRGKSRRAEAQGRESEGREFADLGLRPRRRTRQSDDLGDVAAAEPHAGTFEEADPGFLDGDDFPGDAHETSASSRRRPGWPAGSGSEHHGDGAVSDVPGSGGVRPPGRGSLAEGSRRRAGEFSGGALRASAGSGFEPVRHRQAEDGEPSRHRRADAAARHRRGAEPVDDGLGDYEPLQPRLPVDGEDRPRHAAAPEPRRHRYRDPDVTFEPADRDGGRRR